VVRYHAVWEWNAHDGSVLLGRVLGEMALSSRVSRDKQTLVSSNEPRLVVG